MNPRASFSTTEIGSNGSVSLGSLESVAFNSSFTIELWVYFDTLPDSVDLITRSTEFSLVTQEDALVATVVNGGTFTTGPVLTPNTWVYIAVMSDGSTMFVYVDGVSQGFITVSGGNGPSGNAMTIAGNGFIGQVQMARFWSTNLSTADLVENQFQVYPSGTTDLAAQIDFTEQPAKDSSGNNTPVTESTDDVSLVISSPSVNVLELGFCAPFLDNSVNPGGNATQSDFSVMAWVAPTFVEGSQIIFANGVLGTSGMSLAINSHGNVVFQVGTSTSIVSQAILSAESWANVACTWSASSGNAALFVNGAADNTGTMNKSVAVGPSPLIACGIGSSGTTTGNFIGYVQSVDVFNTVLSATSIASYMNSTSSLAAISACTADYDFTDEAPQNNVTVAEIGLYGTAALSDAIGTQGPIDFQDVALRKQTPRSEPKTIPLPDLDAEAFAPGRRAEMVEEFRRFMTGTLRLPADTQDEYAEQMAAALERLERSVRDGTHRVPHYLTLEEHPDGSATVHLHTAGDSVALFTGPTNCQAWSMGMVFLIVMALFTVFGFTLSSSISTLPPSGIANFLNSRITAVQNALQKIIGSSGPTATTTFAALRELYALGLLKPLIGLVWGILTDSVTWWTIGRVVARMLLLCSPWGGSAAAAFVIDLVAAIGQVVSWWGQQPGNCWTTSAQPEFRRV